MFFIIHPCDPTVVICYLIWPCDTTVCITYLVSHSYSLTYNLRIFQFGCIINTKLLSCDDIILRTSLGFPSWCSERAPATSCENLMMYGGLYQHTRVVLYMYLGFDVPAQPGSAVPRYVVPVPGTSGARCEGTSNCGARLGGSLGLSCIRPQLTAAILLLIN